MRLALRYLLVTPLLSATFAAALAAQASPTPNELPKLRARFVGALGPTAIHVPAFAYTMKGDPTPRRQGAESGGGWALTVALEAERGNRWGGLRVSSVTGILNSNATLIAGYYGVSARRGANAIRAAIGPSLINQRLQVDRLELGLGCLFMMFYITTCPTPQDPSPLTSLGAMATVAAEHSWRAIGIGLEAHAGIGKQPFVGAALRLLLGSFGAQRAAAEER